MFDAVDLASVRSRLALLMECDPDVQVFGASSHHYKLSPPYARSELEAIERELGVTLPADHRAFLLEMGRAGAGPYYGLIEPGPLIEPLFVREGERFPRASSPFPFTREAPFDAPLPAGAQRYDGCILLAQHGCGYASLLVVSGPSAGEVWSDFSEGQGALVPEAPSFLAWYRGWLDAAFYEWASEMLPTLARTRVEGAPKHAGVEAARATIERIAAKEDPKARRTLGYLRLFDGHPDEALAAFEHAHEVEIQEKDARLALDRAVVLAKSGDHGAALRECEQGLASGELWASTKSHLRYLQQRALLALGRRAEALRVLDVRASESRWSADVHYDLARARLEDGDRVGAAAALARAVKMGAGADRGATEAAKFKAICDPFFDELAEKGALADVKALIELLKSGPN